MKYLFVYPPSMLNLAPIIGIPQLIGILEANGVSSKMYDLNADFATNYLNKEFFLKFAANYDYMYGEDFISTIPLDFRDRIVDNKPSKIEVERYSSYFSHRIGFANYVLRNKSLFYNLILAPFAINVMAEVLSRTSFLSTKLYEGLFPGVREYFSFDEKSTRAIDVDFIRYYVTSKANVYKEYFDKKVDELVEESPDCIGVSINTHEQFLPGLTVAYLLKQTCSDIHINIGGAFFSYFHKHFDNLHDVINTFCDSISIGSSDNTVIELIKFLNGEQSIENVPNLLYLDCGSLKQTKKDLGMNLSQYPIASFSGYQRSDYIAPEYILPIQATVSCYWGRCKFCNCSRDRQFQTKSVDKFVEEIEYLSKKYSTKFFYMWDNAFHPEFISDVADLLIKKRLNIKYSFYARLEKEFDKKLLKKLKKSGCTRINWGLDSASERMIELIDKGIDVKEAAKIIRNSSKSGISNLVCLIIGYPTQNDKDLVEDLAFFKENYKYIDKVSTSQAMLILDGSRFAENKKEVVQQIVLSSDERQKHYDKIEKLCADNLSYWDNMATFSLLYSSRYNSRLLKKLNSFIIKITKNKFIPRTIIRFHSFLRNIKLSR